MKKSIGWDTLKSDFKHSFLKWGEYMKRSQIAELKLEKLKRLMLLVDESVSDEIMNPLTIKQWNEFIREFPDEADQLTKKDGV